MLAALVLRALAPDGYMPGSPTSGLLYELCPDGLPAAIMQSLAGSAHHHHHGGDEETTADTDQCPIGHMLASAAVTDLGSVADTLACLPEFPDTQLSTLLSSTTTAYRPRGPPA